MRVKITWEWWKEVEETDGSYISYASDSQRNIPSAITLWHSAGKSRVCSQFLFLSYTNSKETIKYSTWIEYPSIPQLKEAFLKGLHNIFIRNGWKDTKFNGAQIVTTYLIKPVQLRLGYFYCTILLLLRLSWRPELRPRSPGIALSFGKPSHF